VSLRGARLGLNLEYLSAAEYRAGPAADVLGVATFNGTLLDESDPAEAPLVRVRTPVLCGDADVCEVWRCGEPLTAGAHNRVRFRRSDELLFGCIAVVEEDPGGLHAATTLAYEEICAALDASGYPHLLRVWNYLPDINREAAGTERYREFNTARQQALRGSGRLLTGNVPAASALGAATGSPLVVYFLAGRTARSAPITTRGSTAATARCSRAPRWCASAAVSPCLSRERRASSATARRTSATSPPRHARPWSTSRRS
jgi:hypothetical protein